MAAHVNAKPSLLNLVIFLQPVQNSTMSFIFLEDSLHSQKLDCGGRCCPCACHYGTLSSISRTHQSFLLFSHAWHWDESHEKRALSSALTGLYKVTVMCVRFSGGSVCSACCCRRWTGGRCLDACGPLLKGPVKSVQCQIALSLRLSICRT